MVIAVGATWIQPEIVHHGWIVVAILAGFIVGVPLSLVPLTAVPQRTALSHAFGGLAAGRGGEGGGILGGGGGPRRANGVPVEARTRGGASGLFTMSRRPHGP